MVIYLLIFVSATFMIDLWTNEFPWQKSRFQLLAIKDYLKYHFFLISGILKNIFHPISLMCAPKKKWSFLEAALKKTIFQKFSYAWRETLTLLCNVSLAFRFEEYNLLHTLLEEFLNSVWLKYFSSDLNFGLWIFQSPLIKRIINYSNTNNPPRRRTQYFKFINKITY